MNHAASTTAVVSADRNAKADEVIRHHSRSFSIAARLLPKRVRASVHSLYAWCRTVDDAVDAAISDRTAEATLRVLERDLDRIRRGSAPIHAASEWIRPLIAEGQIDVKHAKELIAGMRMDLDGYRVDNEDDLRRYCYHAAGTVGLMMTRLMGVRDAAADRHAVALGIAMQLTNIARDVREDAERGRSYLPGIADPLAEDPRLVSAAVAEVLASAEREYEFASAGLGYLRWDCRFAIRIALACYREIGREITRHRHQVLRGRTVVGKARWIGVLTGTAVTSILADVRITFRSIPRFFQETPMNDPQSVAAKTVAQAKHTVYLGLSLTLIMAAALFLMVFVNPKDPSYSSLPLVYSGASLIGAFFFNRLAARCETLRRTASESLALPPRSIRE